MALVIDDRLAYTVDHERAGRRIQAIEGSGLCVRARTTAEEPYRSEIIWPGRLVRETPDGFVWHYEAWRADMTFRVVDLRRWKREVRPWLVGRWFGELPDFDDEAEMHEWFRRNFCPYGAYIGRQNPDGSPAGNGQAVE